MTYLQIYIVTSTETREGEARWEGTWSGAGIGNLGEAGGYAYREVVLKGNAIPVPGFMLRVSRCFAKGTDNVFLWYIVASIIVVIFENKMGP